MTDYRKKLIEVALPLEAINKEAAREKEPFTRNHPRSLHVWWARVPLTAARAVLFGSLVDDPSGHPERFPTEEAQDKERRRLFRIIEELVKWENSTNDEVLKAARAEILRSTNGHPPPVLDPFCGGGSIPLEAQRLGLEAHASDLNPVAVLITKALVEIPPKFAGRPPINPEARKKLDHTKAWHGTQGLAEDVRYYGQWIRDEAERRIGHLYPKVRLPKEQGGGEATVIAWLWARTVKCPNPACGGQMPLVRSFWLSTKSSKKAWVEPVILRNHERVRFEVREGDGQPQKPPKIGRGAKFRCLLCGQLTDDQHVKDEGSAKRMGAQLIAIVAEGPRGRIYLAANEEHAFGAARAEPKWAPEEELAYDPRNIWCLPYGVTRFRDLFTARQLVALTTFSDLVIEARERAMADARKAGLPDDSKGIDEGGAAATAYADATGTYLALSVARWSDLSNAICTWNSTNQNVRALFSRQAIPMAWDFVELSPFGSVAPIHSTILSAADILKTLTPGPVAVASQLDATIAADGLKNPLVSTDPPYYDNIAYADLSDFFYVWLRRSLSKVHTVLFSTVLTPKAQELVATPYRFEGDKERARDFFEKGLSKAFARLREVQDPTYPLSVYYAFKQSETEEGQDDNDNAVPTVVSTGWETMLEGLLKADFAVTGTWPLRCARGVRSIALGTNALASYIVLVCRPRGKNAPLATRREFVNALKTDLPSALRKLQRGNIAPVDLAQAAIGPGMAVFSRYAKVVEADGAPMTVRTALALINQTLDEVLAEQESEFDADTRWALAWFEQYAFNEGPFGVAETLSKAKNTSVQGMVEAGIVSAKGGKVRLLGQKDIAEDWDPTSERRLTIWEVAHYLIRALENEGESGAAALMRKVGALGETARDLAYRLYGICERKKWAQEALPYNSLVVAWPEITRLARSERPSGEQLPLR